MAQISDIGPTLFARLDYAPGLTPSAFETLAGMTAVMQYTTLSGTSNFGTPGNVSQVPNVREFPSFGTPANIVNVPVYGSTTSRQIQGQADFPAFEFTLNYVPSQHAAISALVGGGATQLFRLRLSNNSAANVSTPVPVGATEASEFYFQGTIASLEVTPSLSDSMQATMSVAISSAILGPLTQPTS